MRRQIVMAMAVMAFSFSSPAAAQVVAEETIAEFPPVTTAQRVPASAQQPETQFQRPLSPSPASQGAPVAQPSIPPVALPVDNLPPVTEAGQATAEDINKQLNTMAFETAATGLLPLSPFQIRELLRRVEESQQAAADPLNGPPRPEVRVVTLSLDPGVDPPEIQVSAGIVTTITMLDASGQPWPIKTVAVGGSFDVPQPEENAHILRVTPLTKFGAGNLSITLQNLATPITFRLKAGGESVHYRFDARVPEYGPNASVPIIDRLEQVSAGDGVIMAVLDGTPPRGAQKLDVGGVDSRTGAWKVGDQVFLRTPLKLLSPSWTASVSSADGMTVYEVNDAPVFLLSDNGVLVRARVTLREKLNEY